MNNLDRIKNYCLQNRDRIKEYQLKIQNKIVARKKTYSNDEYKSDINFPLTCKTRSIKRQALNRKTKAVSTKEPLLIDIDLYRNWIEFQFTPEMNWQNTEIDHVKPIYLFEQVMNN